MHSGDACNFLALRRMLMCFQIRLVLDSQAWVQSASQQQFDTETTGLQDKLNRKYFKWNCSCVVGGKETERQPFSCFKEEAHMLLNLPGTNDPGLSSQPHKGERWGKLNSGQSSPCCPTSCPMAALHLSESVWGRWLHPGPSFSLRLWVWSVPPSLSCHVPSLCAERECNRCNVFIWLLQHWGRQGWLQTESSVHSYSWGQIPGISVNYVNLRRTEARIHWMRCSTNSANDSTISDQDTGSGWPEGFWRGQHLPKVWTWPWVFSSVRLTNQQVMLLGRFFLFLYIYVFMTDRF